MNEDYTKTAKATAYNYGQALADVGPVMGASMAASSLGQLARPDVQKSLLERVSDLEARLFHQEDMFNKICQNFGDRLNRLESSIGINN